MHKVVLQFGGSSVQDIEAFTKAIQLITERSSQQIAEWIIVASPMLLKKTNQLSYIGYISGNGFVRNRYKTVIAASRVLQDIKDTNKYTVALNFLELRLNIVPKKSGSRINNILKDSRIHDLIVEGVNEPCDGYGGSTIALLRHLEEFCNVGFVPINQTSSRINSRIKKLITNGKANKYLIYRSPMSGWFNTTARPRPTDSKKALMTMFETTSTPTTWKERVGDKVDMVIVPCTHCKDVLLKDGWDHVPITIIPLGFREDIFKYKERVISTDRPYRFLFQFASHPLADDRKNTLNVLNAFNMCFADNKDVELIIKASGALDQGILMTLPSNARVISGALQIEEIRDLFYTADCFLFPTRGEGYGLPPREAMATGLPVIITDFSGLADIADPSMCFPITPEKLIPAIYPHEVGLRHQNGNRMFGLWADVPAHLIAEQMMIVYNNQKRALKVGKKASTYMHSEETSQIAASNILSLMNKL